MNSTTHALKTLIKGLRLYSEDKEVNHRCLHSLSGFTNTACPELVPYLESCGGFDVIWKALDTFKDSPDGYELLSAMQGLSDPSHADYGAQLIANHGGKLQGLKYLINLLGAREAYVAHDGYLTLKYEVMQVINGILENDHSGEFCRAVLDQGLVAEAVKAMNAEPDIR